MLSAEQHSFVRERPAPFDDVDVDLPTRATDCDSINYLDNEVVTPMLAQEQRNFRTGTPVEDID